MHTPMFLMHGVCGCAPHLSNARMAHVNAWAHHADQLRTYRIWPFTEGRGVWALAMAWPLQPFTT